MKPEAIEQLWSELTFLRVSRPYQNEPGRVADRYSLSLDDVAAAGSRIQQNIHQVIVEQVDLVDVEKAPICPSQQARLESLHSLSQGPLDIERAAHSVLCGAERQIDNPHFSTIDRQPGESLLSGPAIIAQLARVSRVATVQAAPDPRNTGQEVGERSDGRGFPSASMPEYHYSPDIRVDHRKNEGELHFFLADDCRKRVDGADRVPA